MPTDPRRRRPRLTTTLTLALAGCASGLRAPGGQLAPAHTEALPRDEEARRAGDPLGEQRGADPATGGSRFTHHGVRPFVSVETDPLSTFALDVDTGSYTVCRRELRAGRLPPEAAVRPEEFVNTFRQDYPEPRRGPFAVVSHAAPSPFRPGQTILRVGLQGRRVSSFARRRANLVFLVDVSGSMQAPDKIGLVQESLTLLTRALRPDDLVSICTYAGYVETVLPPTPATEQRRIVSALARLSAGGSTAMGSGIDLAYRLAAEHAGPGVSSRVIVCSDGDANVGPTDHEGILRLIEAHRGRGITLGTVGFGAGDYRDTVMEQLADRGNGSYAYVDGLREARRLFVEDLTQSLELLARDVKAQVRFDPARVRRYRLIGYENRALPDERFRDDRVDAGEVGAGHTVTALYELELVPGSRGPLGELRLRYRDAAAATAEDAPAHEVSLPLTSEVAASFAETPQRMRLVACAAEFAEVLRGSPYAQSDLRDLAALTEASLDPRHDDREQDLLLLIERAAYLQAQRPER